MPQPSNPVQRVMTILNFFAEHPRQAFSLTQVIKALRMSRATCYSMLTTLSDGGYLHRNPDKSFILGPRLLGLARTTQEHFSPLDVARQEMRVLADEFDLIIAALFVDNDEIVVRERTASGRHLRWLPPIMSVRYPSTPASTVLMTVAAVSQLEPLLETMKTPLSKALRQQLRDQAQLVERQGYLAATDKLPEPSSGGLSRLKAGFGELITEARTDRSYSVQLLAAPVLNGDAVAFVLVAHGFERPYTGAEVAYAGERLRDACGRISAFMSGTKPLPLTQPKAVEAAHKPKAEAKRVAPAAVSKKPAAVRRAREKKAGSRPLGRPAAIAGL